MTKDRDFKRRVRARMAKTGESYTTARAHLLAPSHGDATPPGPAQVGPTHQVGPTDQAEPTDQAGGPVQVQPTDPTEPTDQVGPTDQAGPTDQVGPTDQTKPNAQAGSTDRTDPTDQAQPTDQAGGPARPATPDLATLAGMSDEAVARSTGRDWAAWASWLDDRSAAERSHAEIARLVAAEVESGWWAQTVAVGYERIRGLRETGQRRDGAYEANRSRTIAVDAATLYRWIAEPELRDRWLPPEVQVRSLNPPRSVRLDWPDGTRVQLYVESKTDEKARLSAQHTELPDRAALETRQTYWADRLETLKALLA